MGEREAWCPCRHGIPALIKGLQWVAHWRPNEKDLRHIASRPSRQLLQEADHGRVCGLWSPTHEVLRRWLQFHGHAPVADEVDKRWRDVEITISTWEMRARHVFKDRARRKSFANNDALGELEDGYDDIVWKAKDLADYLLQLNEMLSETLRVTLERPMATPSDLEAALALQALYELEAFDEAGRVQERRITALADRDPKATSRYKKALGRLKKKGLVASLPGPKGGYWLTSSGKAEAERLVRNSSEPTRTDPG